MDLITDVPALRAAGLAFAVQYGSNLPASAQTALVAAGSAVSPVDAACNTAELLYASLGAITDAPTKAAAQTLCAQCALMGATNGWQQLGVNGRGSGIYQAMCRELGLSPPTGTTWPTSSADPAPSTVYTAPSMAAPQIPSAPS
jgi:hypothetical protein